MTARTLYDHEYKVVAALERIVHSYVDSRTYGSGQWWRVVRRIMNRHGLALGSLRTSVQMRTEHD